MKKTKKLMSALLAVAMAFSLLAASASAAAPAATVEDLAYMDTATASPAQKEAILAARRQIVFGDRSWTVNGAVSVQTRDGKWEPLPEFSALWPDWDLDEISRREPDPFPAVTGGTGTFPVLFDRTIWLPAESNFENAPNFYEFTANGKPVYAWASGMGGGYRCNIGFEDRNTGRNLGWKTAWIGERVRLDTTWGARYGVRASTAEDVGHSASMIVSEDPNRIPTIDGTIRG